MFGWMHEKQMLTRGSVFIAPKNDVESEMNSLMSCNMYIDMNARINLFACANDVIDNFNSLNKKNQFIFMLHLRKFIFIFIFHIFRAWNEHKTLNAGHDTVNSHF